MNLQDLEHTLNRFAETSILSECERDAAKAACDVVSALRDANSLPPSFAASDLVSLVRHKSQLPERPQCIVRLPSCDGSQYDRYAVLPHGLGLQSAIKAANAAIQRANEQDHQSPMGGCANGYSVEENVREAMEGLGFVFLAVEETNNWDEYTETQEAAEAVS